VHVTEPREVPPQVLLNLENLVMTLKFRSLIGRSLPLLALLAGAALAQQFVYPAKGQTAEQQKTDEAACYIWAVEQTGFDPAKPVAAPVAAAPAPAPAPRTGVTPGAGLKGAAKGAVIGEIVTGDSDAGAAAGLVAARGASRKHNAAAAQQSQQQAQSQATAQQQQQATAAADQQKASFAKARSACLEGKGYTVK
jgi:hypothetical protein